MVTKALYVLLEAKAGREDEVEEFLRGALPLAEAEPDTTTWYAVRFGPTTFAIFDTFPDDAGRQAHLSGNVAGGLMARADELFAEAPLIEQIDVLAAKVPDAS